MKTIDTTKGRTGFSLIELMVVIAIVALLTAVAVPSYTEYVNRSRVAEVQTLTGNYLKVWAEVDASGGSYPATITTPGSYIASAAITANNVVITLNNPSGIDTILNGQVITYTPTVGTASVTWACVLTASSAAKLVYFPDCT